MLRSQPVARLVCVALAPLLLGAAWDDTRWSPAVEALVADAVRAHAAAREGADPRPVAVFDFDNTLLFGDIAFVTIPLLVEEGRFGFDPADPEGLFRGPVAARFAALKLEAPREAPGAALRAPARAALVDAIVADLHARYDAERAKDGKPAALAYLARLFTGLTPEQTRQLARDALARAEKAPLCRRTIAPPEGAPGEPRQVVPGARARPALKRMIERLEAAGFEIWIVSASPARLVEGAAEAFGIPAERVIGVRTEEPGGRLSDRVVPPITWRAGKRAAIEAQIGRRPALVFGDAWTDYEMLTWAERGVLVDTGDDARLRAAVAKEGVVIQPPFGAERDLPACP